MSSLKSIRTSTTLSGRFSRGVAWATIGTALSQGIGLVVSVFCARMLGKVHYGEFGIIQSTIGMYGVFAGLWLGLGATKFVAEFKVGSPDRAGRIIGFSFLIAVVSSVAVSIAIIAMAPYLAKHVLNAPHLSTELVFVAGIIVLNVLDGVQVGVLSGFEAFGAIARTSVIRSLVALPITVTLIWKWGLGGAVFSLAVIGFLNLWINHRALRIECRKFGVIISWRGNSADLWSFINFSTPAVFGGLLGAPVLWAANSMLVNTPSGYAQMGIYAIASQWRNAVMFLPRRFISVALPIMSAEVTKGDEDSRCREVFDLTQRLSIAIVIPLVTLLLFSGHWIVKIYGESYGDGRLALLGMLLTTGITGLGAGGGPIVQAKGKMWFGLATNVLWSAIFLLSVWYFVAEWGACAITFGMAFAYLVQLLVTFFWLRDELPEGTLLRSCAGSLFLVLLTALAAAATPMVSAIAMPFLVLTMAFVFFYYLRGKDVIAKFVGVS